MTKDTSQDRSQEQSLAGQLRESIKNLYAKLNVPISKSKEKQFENEVNKGTFLDNGLPESLVNALFGQNEQGRFTIRILPERKDQGLFWISPIIEIVNYDNNTSVECNISKPYQRENILYFKDDRRKQMQEMIDYKSDVMEEGPHAGPSLTEFNLVGFFEYKPASAVEDLRNSIAFTKTIEVIAKNAHFIS